MFIQAKPACQILLLSLVAFSVRAGRGDEPERKTPASLNDLSMEVAALHVIHQFHFTPDQLQLLRKMARETSQEREIRQVPRASDKYKGLLTDLRSALVSGNEEKMDKLQQELDKLRSAEPAELDDGIDITDAARREAPRLLRLLGPRQIALHLSYYGDQVPDPAAVLESAIDKVRDLKDKDWKQLREEISDQVGPLVVGLDVEKAGQVSDRAIQLLIEVRALSKQDFERRRAELRKQAREIVGDTSPFDVLQHLVEQALAEMLSNPRLASALNAREQK
jgi:hypothetical protein